MSVIRFQEAVRSLSGRELAELIGALGRGGANENDVAGVLLGLCLEAAVERLRGEEFTAKAQRPQRDAKEEGGMES
jgi:hypothetical protein